MFRIYRVLKDVDFIVLIPSYFIWVALGGRGYACRALFLYYVYLGVVVAGNVKRYFKKLLIISAKLAMPTRKKINGIFPIYLLWYDIGHHIHQPSLL